MPTDEEAQREVRRLMTQSLTDQATIETLSRAGNMAKNKREDLRANREAAMARAAAAAEAEEEAQEEREAKPGADKDEGSNKDKGRQKGKQNEVEVDHGGSEPDKNKT
ncbi:hypothetical protein F66182_9906 [Fusarium sp. NRRL 66182]|nr:hypothetical protein F66182_9906 [Fusarium sp. NRRL 66182]